jgi:hypothetical protein
MKAATSAVVTLIFRWRRVGLSFRCRQPWGAHPRIFTTTSRVAGTADGGSGNRGGPDGKRTSPQTGSTSEPHSNRRLGKDDAPSIPSRADTTGETADRLRHPPDRCQFGPARGSTIRRKGQWRSEPQPKQSATSWSPDVWSQGDTLRRFPLYWNPKSLQPRI